MGFLRLLLALAVVCWHAGSFLGMPLMPGDLAVEAFFVISGFYMALILNTKYVGPGSYGLFLSNRLLRIFPTYWLVLAATFVTCLALQASTGHSQLSLYRQPLPTSTLLALTAAQVFIVGQDLVRFLGLNPDGSLYLAKNYYSSPSPTPFSFLLVGQAWTMSLELMFYAIAPFLVRKGARAMAGWVAASLLVRAILYFGLGLQFDPWKCNFFPSELALFMSGAIAFRLLERLRTIELPRGASAAVSVVLLAISAGYGVLPMPQMRGAIHVKSLGYLSLVTVALPFLFRWSGKSGFDRAVGDLSYPVYLLHSLVITVLDGTLTPGATAFLRANGLNSLVVFAVSVAGSLAIIHALINPLERYRQSRVERFDSPRGVPAPAIDFVVFGESARH